MVTIQELRQRGFVDENGKLVKKTTFTEIDRRGASHGTYERTYNSEEYGVEGDRIVSYTKNTWKDGERPVLQETYTNEGQAATRYEASWDPSGKKMEATADNLLTGERRDLRREKAIAEREAERRAGTRAPIISSSQLAQLTTYTYDRKEKEYRTPLSPETFYEYSFDDKNFRLTKSEYESLGTTKGALTIQKQQGLSDTQLKSVILSTSGELRSGEYGLSNPEIRKYQKEQIVKRYKESQPKNESVTAETGIFGKIVEKVKNIPSTYDVLGLRGEKGKVYTISDDVNLTNQKLKNVPTTYDMFGIRGEKGKTYSYSEDFGLVERKTQQFGTFMLLKGKELESSKIETNLRKFETPFTPQGLTISRGTKAIGYASLGISGAAGTFKEKPAELALIAATFYLGGVGVGVLSTGGKVAVATSKAINLGLLGTSALAIGGTAYQTSQLETGEERAKFLGGQAPFYLAAGTFGLGYKQATAQKFVKGSGRVRQTYGKKVDITGGFSENEIKIPSKVPINEPFQSSNVKTIYEWQTKTLFRKPKSYLSIVDSKGTSNLFLINEGKAKPLGTSKATPQKVSRDTLLKTSEKDTAKITTGDGTYLTQDKTTVRAFEFRGENLLGRAARKTRVQQTDFTGLSRIEMGKESVSALTNIKLSRKGSINVRKSKSFSRYDIEEVAFENPDIQIGAFRKTPPSVESQIEGISTGTGFFQKYKTDPIGSPKYTIGKQTRYNQPLSTIRIETTVTRGTFDIVPKRKDVMRGSKFAQIIRDEAGRIFNMGRKGQTALIDSGTNKLKFDPSVYSTGKIKTGSKISGIFSPERDIISTINQGKYIYRTFPTTKASQKPESSFKMFTGYVPEYTFKISPSIITVPKTTTKTRTRTRQDLITTTIGKTYTPTLPPFIPVIPPETPPKTPPMFSIDFGGGFDGFKSGSGKRIIKGKYKPSLFGLSLGKTIKKAPKFTSGIGLRLPVATRGSGLNFKLR